MSKVYALVLLLVGVLLWSLTGVAIKLVAWDAWSITAARSLIAAIAVLIFTRRLPAVRHPRAWLAAVAFALAGFVFVYGVKYGEPALVIVLAYTPAIFTPILEFICSRKLPQKSQVVGILVMVLGLALANAEGLTRASIVSILAGLGSGLGFTIWAMLRNSIKDESQIPSSVVWGLFLQSMLLFLKIPELLQGAFPTDSTSVIFLFVGGIAYGVGYVLVSKSFAEIPLGLALILISAEVPLFILWASIGTGEWPSPLKSLGAFVIFLTCLTLSVLEVWKKKPESASTV